MAVVRAGPILLVDDQPRVLRTLARLLDRHFDLQTATDADGALELLASSAFHAVVTDFSMPNKDGIWLLEQVRIRHPAMRRVLVSGQVVEGLSRHLATGLVERFFSKPLAAGALEAWLSCHLPG